MDSYVQALREYRGSKSWSKILGERLVSNTRMVNPKDLVMLQPFVFNVESWTYELYGHAVEIGVRIQNCA